MNKKVLVFGGGTGLSTLLRGLKNFPLDITAVVSVSDDGKSTGKLRKEFNMPAVGDIRRVIISLSETEPLIEKMLDYRFNTYTDLDGHTVGNLLLTAMTNITGNLGDGIKALSNVLNLKGTVIPLTEENVSLMAKMKDGNVIEGEQNITKYDGKIKKIYYKKKPKINEEVIDAINDADYIILSMGSIYTSIIPNLICKEVIEAIDKAKGKIMYICNIMTQPGETDDFKASDHVKLLNEYLGKRKIETLIVNKEHICEDIRSKYETTEQKDPVLCDRDNLKKMNLEVINSDLVYLEEGCIRHDFNKLATIIYLRVIDQKIRI